MENKSVKAPVLVQCVLAQQGMASGKVLAHTEILGVQTELRALKSFLVISFATAPQIVWSLCEQMNRHLCEYQQVYPRGSTGGRLPVVWVVTKYLLPCSGKTKLILETSKSSPSVHHVVLMSYPPAVGSDAVCHWVAAVGQQLFACPPVWGGSKETGCIGGPYPSHPNDLLGFSLRWWHHVMLLGLEFLLSFLWAFQSSDGFTCQVLVLLAACF